MCVCVFGFFFGLTGPTGSKRVVIVWREEEPSGAASYSAQFGAAAGVCVCVCLVGESVL